MKFLRSTIRTFRFKEIGILFFVLILGWFGRIREFDEIYQNADDAEFFGSIKILRKFGVVFTIKKTVRLVSVY